MNKKLTILLSAAILLLLLSNVFFAVRYFMVKDAFLETKADLKTQQINEKTLDFTGLFIKEVLKSESEVDFETRLKLENAVREIGDEEILNQWNNFTKSETEEKAQENVEILLEMLVGKIKIK